MTRVLNLEPQDFSDQAIAVVREVAEHVALPDGIGRDDPAFAAHLAEADILWTRLAYQVDRGLLDLAPRLRAVVTATTGLTHLDLDALAARDIAVLCLKGEETFLSSITATADLTWALALDLFRHVVPAHLSVTREGAWNRDRFRGRQLQGHTLGLYGLGRLGRIVARYGVAFGMRVLAHDERAVEPVPGVTLVTREQLLAEADLLSLHVNYEPRNRHLIDSKAIRAMKPGTLLVNTSRGELVDEAALLAALEDGHLGGAGLDVLDDESRARMAGLEHPLIGYAARHGNLILTPHIGGACRDAMAATEIFMAKKLKRFLSGGET